MTKKEFMNRIGKDRSGFLPKFLDILKKGGVPFCVIGGLAVNAYAEPVVSLDMDIVVVPEKLENLMDVLGKKFKVKQFPNSINIFSKDSDFRIQLQTDPRYLPFIKKARLKDVLGYRIPVARSEDVLQGKIWAAMDQTRRPSKRQKDLSDILRLIEKQPKLSSLVPEALKKQMAFSG